MNQDLLNRLQAIADKEGKALLQLAEEITLKFVEGYEQANDPELIANQKAKKELEDKAKADRKEFLAASKATVDAWLHLSGNADKILTYVYTLELEGGMYYVGYSADVRRRLLQHVSGSGSNMTKQFAPVRIVDLRHGDEETERQTTFEMMKKYGIDKVRGSHWAQPTLSETTKAKLHKLIYAQ